MTDDTDDRATDEPPLGNEFPVVGIGASAGGMDACADLLSGQKV